MGKMKIYEEPNPVGYIKKTSKTSPGEEHIEKKYAELTQGSTEDMAGFIMRAVINTRRYERSIAGNPMLTDHYKRLVSAEAIAMSVRIAHTYEEDTEVLSYTQALLDQLPWHGIKSKPVIQHTISSCEIEQAFTVQMVQTTE